MFIEQYVRNTGVVGARGQGEVDTPSILDNALNRYRLDWIIKNVPPGTYTYDEFRALIVGAFTKPNGKSAGHGARSNWQTALFKSNAKWIADDYGFTRGMNRTKTDTITVPGKPKPKARKGKAKAQQATLPGLE